MFCNNAFAGITELKLAEKEPEAYETVAEIENRKPKLRINKIKYVIPAIIIHQTKLRKPKKKTVPKKTTVKMTTPKRTKESTKSTIARTTTTKRITLTT